jgi:hypothetical protein
MTTPPALGMRWRLADVITGLPIWVRLNVLDGAPLRMHGHETFNVWGTNKTSDTLVLDVLVR